MYVVAVVVSLLYLISMRNTAVEQEHTGETKDPEIFNLNVHTGYFLYMVWERVPTSTEGGTMTTEGNPARGVIMGSGNERG